MANSIKTQEDILEKLQIEALNPMQEEATSVIEKNNNTIFVITNRNWKDIGFFFTIVKVIRS